MRRRAGLVVCYVKSSRCKADSSSARCPPRPRRTSRAEAGADETILYTKEDFEAAVKRITDGKGVNVVYDSVGKDTFDKSLASLAPLGYLVAYGQASGFPPPFDIQRLAGGRSLFLTRPTVFSYISTREELLAHADAVFDMIMSGKLKLHIERTYPLEQAAEAQEALASRQTVGKLLLIP